MNYALPRWRGGRVAKSTKKRQKILAWMDVKAEKWGSSGQGEPFAPWGQGLVLHQHFFVAEMLRSTKGLIDFCIQSNIFYRICCNRIEGVCLCLSVFQYVLYP